MLFTSLAVMLKGKGKSKGSAPAPAPMQAAVRPGDQAHGKAVINHCKPSTLNPEP